MLTVCVALRSFSRALAAAPRCPAVTTITSTFFSVVVFGTALFGVDDVFDGAVEGAAVAAGLVGVAAGLALDSASLGGATGWVWDSAGAAIDKSAVDCKHSIKALRKGVNFAVGGLVLI